MLPVTLDVFCDFPDLSSHDDMLDPELKVKLDDAAASSQICRPPICVGENGVAIVVDDVYNPGRAHATSFTA
jgi:hypothetical protein